MALKVKNPSANGLPHEVFRYAKDLSIRACKKAAIKPTLPAFWSELLQQAAKGTENLREGKVSVLFQSLRKLIISQKFLLTYRLSPPMQMRRHLTRKDVSLNIHTRISLLPQYRGKRGSLFLMPLLMLLLHLRSLKMCCVAWL